MKWFALSSSNAHPPLLGIHELESQVTLVYHLTKCHIMLLGSNKDNCTVASDIDIHMYL